MERRWGWGQVGSICCRWGWGLLGLGEADQQGRDRVQAGGGVGLGPGRDRVVIGLWQVCSWAVGGLHAGYGRVVIGLRLGGGWVAAGRW